MAVREYYGAVLRAPHYPLGPPKRGVAAGISRILQEIRATQDRAERGKLYAAFMQATWEAQRFALTLRSAERANRTIKRLLNEDLRYLPLAHHVAAAKILRAIAEIRSSASLPAIPASPP